MDFVILVKSCWRDKERGLHGVIRATWGCEDKYADIRFVLGRPTASYTLADDELIVNADDGYDYLWEKTREANLWALSRNSCWAFHCCTDTYVVVPRLVRLRELGRPYVGCVTPDGHLSGGAGYLLNKAAMFQLANSRWYPGWEDKVVYELLDKSCIRPTSLPIFRGAEPKPWDTDTVSVHLGTHTGSLTAEMLENCDRRFMEASYDAC